MLNKNPLVKIAFTHLFAKKRQTVVAMLGVMFGIAVFIFQAGLITGFQTTFIDRTINTTANIRIHNEAEKNRKPLLNLVFKSENDWNVVRNQKPKDENPRIRNGSQIMEAIERYPEVTGVSPFLGSQVIFRMGIAQQSGRAAGVDIIKENAIFDLAQYMKEGDLTKLQTIPNGIILGSGLAENLGANMNDNINVISPLGVTIEMKVVGINESGLTEVDKTRAFINIRNAQKLLKVDGDYITDINIKLKDINKAEKLASELEKKFGYKADDWKVANSNIFGVFRIQNMITILVITSILIVSGFGIFNIQMMVIYEKLPDIAILKAIGFKDRDVRRIFLMEAIFIGLAGGLLGLLLGHILTSIIGSIPLNIKGFITMKYLQFNRSPLFYIFAFIFSIVVTAIAGFLPARKASKIDPIEIIRGK